MSIIDELITNRADTGFYGVYDLNRVGVALNYVANRLASAGNLISISPKTDWGMQDIPTRSQMAAYLNDIAVIRGVLAVMPTTPLVPSGAAPFNAQEANNIERILQDIDGLITNMMAAYRHSGMITAGQGGLIL